eukprot:2963028-Rhodomonas_salina.1
MSAHARPRHVQEHAHPRHVSAHHCAQTNAPVHTPADMGSEGGREGGSGGRETDGEEVKHRKVLRRHAAHTHTPCPGSVPRSVHTVPHFSTRGLQE